jgi:hypothetical protein
MNTVVSPAEWRAAREALLAEEKAMTRALDALRARRAAMPWVRVEKEYVFATPDGPRTLAQKVDHGLWPGDVAAQGSAQRLAKGAGHKVDRYPRPRRGAAALGAG